MRFGEGLLREDAIGTLDPRPAMKELFPLRSYLEFGASSGMTEPDGAVLGDLGRPLVLYGRPESRANGLKLGKTKDRRLRLYW